MDTKTILDVETGKTTVVPLTDEEIAQRELDAKQDAIRAAQEAPKAAAKAEAKQAILDKLGLTAEEVSTLLG